MIGYRVAREPELWVIEDALSTAECSEILDFFSSEQTHAALAHHYGWDASGFISEMPAEVHPGLARAAGRIEALTGVQPAVPATARFRCYAPGEGHPPHTDAYDDGDLRLALSSLIFLQETEAGGETVFPLARPYPVAVSPRRGRLLIWTGTLEDGATDPASEHEGAKVRAGSKAVLLYFYYLRAPGSRPAMPALTRQLGERPAPGAMQGGFWRV